MQMHNTILSIIEICSLKLILKELHTYVHMYALCEYRNLLWTKVNPCRYYVHDYYINTIIMYLKTALP